jgi:hypothetical protein
MAMHTVAEVCTDAGNEACGCTLPTTIDNSMRRPRSMWSCQQIYIRLQLEATLLIVSK